MKLQIEINCDAYYFQSYDRPRNEVLAEILEDFAVTISRNPEVDGDRIVTKKHGTVGFWNLTK